MKFAKATLKVSRFFFLTITFLAFSLVAVFAQQASGELRTVSRVIDGDTIVLENGEKVRLIGVDTPETHHPQKPVEYFGKEAKFLQPDQWWRIVKLDLSDKDHMIDWTHEREWRAPDDFEFKLEKATVLVPSRKVYKYFIQQCRSELPDALCQLGGIVVMDRILY